MQANLISEPACRLAGHHEARPRVLAGRHTQRGTADLPDMPDAGEVGFAADTRPASLRFAGHGR